MTTFAPIDSAIAAIRRGDMIVLVDDPERENEGDLVMAAEHAEASDIAFMERHARGMICVPLDHRICDRLDLPQQAPDNRSLRGTAFTVTVDAAEGTTTGISADERARTIRTLADPTARPDDLLRPGHISPIRAREGGVLVRAGHTEGATDLARLAGLEPAGVVCEIKNDDGSMARLPDLEVFCAEHGLLLVNVADLIAHRRRTETLVERVESVNLPTRWGRFRLHLYRSQVDDQQGMVLAYGGVGESDHNGNVDTVDDPVLVRVHSECLTGDVFASLRCDCGEQLDAAMQRIVEEGSGVILYLRQEGRGIGLRHKLAAYRLQEQGMDTVQANEAIGFKPDLRDYGIGAQILHHMGVRRIRLMTNNPQKIVGFHGHDLEVVERVELAVEPNPENKDYLRAKRDKLGHLLGEDL